MPPPDFRVEVGPERPIGEAAGVGRVGAADASSSAGEGDERILGVVAPDGGRRGRRAASSAQIGGRSDRGGWINRGKVQGDEVLV